MDELSRSRKAKVESAGALNREDWSHLHDWSIAKFGGMPGIREPGGVDAIVARPDTAVFGKVLFETAFAQAAAVLEATVVRHVGWDGNKRTALAAAAFILNQGGYELTISNREAAALVLAVVSHQVTLDELTEQLEDGSRWAKSRDMEEFCSWLETTYGDALAELGQ